MFLALGAIVGYWVGRDVEYRLMERELQEAEDEMDAVQPADPYIPTLFGGSMSTGHVDWGGIRVYLNHPYSTGVNNEPPTTSDNLDLTYNDALAKNAIRRTRTDA